MAGRVEGKVAFVVGGGQTPGETIGNGRATAMTLAREGALVAVADRRLESAEDTAAMIQEAGGVAEAGMGVGHGWDQHCRGCDKRWLDESCGHSSYPFRAVRMSWER